MMTQLIKGRTYDIFYPTQNHIEKDNNIFVNLIKTNYPDCRFEVFVAMSGLSNIQFVEVIRDVKK